jgi:osmotically-inducible protein OsmY
MQTMMEKETGKQLREAVLRQLEWDPQIVSTDISVNAKEGAVTLTGFVHSYAEKIAGERPVRPRMIWVRVAGTAAASIFSIPKRRRPE